LSQEGYQRPVSIGPSQLGLFLVVFGSLVAFAVYMRLIAENISFPQMSALIPCVDYSG
jgi:hypothetical protein